MANRLWHSGHTGFHRLRGGSVRMVTGAEYLLNLWKKPTARDKQIKIGASQFGSPCTYCVGEALLNEAGSSAPRPYWLGAAIGTAIHERIETMAIEDNPNLMLETRVTIGELPDYGAITSSLDYYDPDTNTLIDWKTTTADKLKMYKFVQAVEPSPTEVSKASEARFVMQKYIGQLMSYGLGLENAGHKVERASIVFIVRGGKTDDDIWSVDLDYDREYALKVWDRLARLWDYLREGGDLESLPKHIHCYTCSTR